MDGERRVRQGRVKPLGKKDEEGQVDFAEMVKRANPYKLERNFAPRRLDGQERELLQPIPGHKAIPRRLTPIFFNLGSSEESKSMGPIAFNAIASATAPISGRQRPVVGWRNRGIRCASGKTPTWDIAKVWTSAIFSDEPPRDSVSPVVRPWIKRVERRADESHRRRVEMDGRRDGQMFGLGPLLTPKTNQENLPQWAKNVQRIPVLARTIQADNYLGVPGRQARGRMKRSWTPGSAHASGPETKSASKRLLPKEKGDRRNPGDDAEYKVLGALVFP